MNASDKHFFYLGAEAWPGGMTAPCETSEAQWVNRPRRRLAFRLIFAASVVAAGCAAFYLIADEGSPVHQAAALL